MEIVEFVLNREIQPPPEGGGLLSHQVKKEFGIDLPIECVGGIEK
jgi:hypothetical protein